MSQIHLSITTLADLGQDLEVTVSQTSSTFAQVGPFSTEVFAEGTVILLLGSLWRSREGGLESSLSRLTVVNIREEIEVIVEEV